MAPVPSRLYETHLNVSNLERSMAFYESVVGLTLGMKDDVRRIAFYFIGGWGKSMLGLWEKPQDQIQTQHLAFEVPLEELNSAIAGLRDKGVTTKGFSGEATTDPIVFGWMPAAAIYFEDPDGHLLEYIALLSGDPRPDLPVTDWDTWHKRAPARRS